MKRFSRVLISMGIAATMMLGCRVSARGACFTTPLDAYALQRAIPSARGGVTAPSPHRPTAAVTEC